jgi:hypothetical protein
MMEAARTSETLVNYKTTRRYNPEDSHFHRLRVFENRVLRGIFGPKRDEGRKSWKKNCIMRSCMICALNHIIMRMIKSIRMRLAGHVARMGQMKIAYKILFGRCEGSDHSEVLDICGG